MPVAFSFALDCAAKAIMSKGCRYVAVSLPSFQEQFESTKPNSLRFSAGDFCGNNSWARQARSSNYQRITSLRRLFAQPLHSVRATNDAYSFGVRTGVRTGRGYAFSTLSMSKSCRSARKLFSNDTARPASLSSLGRTLFRSLNPRTVSRSLPISSRAASNFEFVIRAFTFHIRIRTSPACVTS